MFLLTTDLPKLPRGRHTVDWERHVGRPSRWPTPPKPASEGGKRGRVVPLDTPGARRGSTGHGSRCGRRQPLRALGGSHGRLPAQA
eukprot:3267238-Alexandrium_andersonii.AAC.1